ncbi:MAG: signal peptidase I [Thermoplasmata archaeon]|nr:signal peptidase I [Thermoplasmata archaeon]
MPESRASHTSPVRSSVTVRRRLASSRVEVQDRSMEPALRQGDRLWVEPVRSCRTGEIVVIRDPELPERLLIKRVGAVAGDRVFVTRTGVLPVPLGGEGKPPEDALELVDVPERHIFLVSDRPKGSRDSRRFGPVPTRLLVGRAWHRYFPPDRRGDPGESNR